MFEPLAPTRAPNSCIHPGAHEEREPVGEAPAPASPYGSTERIPSFEDTAPVSPYGSTERIPSFEDIAPDDAAPTPVCGDEITEPIRVNRTRVPVARA